MRTLILSVMILGALVGSSQLYGQEKSKKELRKEAREMEYNQNKSQMSMMLESETFKFIATELETSGYAAISNIRLNALYFVDLTPGRFSCYLPIYGMSSPVGRATLRRQLNINNNKYEMTVKDIKNRGFIVEIITRDNVGNTRYTFNLDITPDGKMSRLRVSTDFQTPVSYSGYVVM